MCVKIKMKERKKWMSSRWVLLPWKEKGKVSRDCMQLMVEGLLSMGKDLGSIPSTAKRKWDSAIKLSPIEIDGNLKKYLGVDITSEIWSKLEENEKEVEMPPLEKKQCQKWVRLIWEQRCNQMPSSWLLLPSFPHQVLQWISRCDPSPG